MPTVPMIFIERVDRASDVAAFHVPPGADPIDGGAPSTINPGWQVYTFRAALPQVRIRLAADGEVLVHSPGNFVGYLHDEAATAVAFTEDGFFRPGDLGEIDADGLPAHHRSQEGAARRSCKKELIVTAGGKSIPPVNIEKRLEGGLVGQAVVTGSERPYLVALLALDPDALSALARQRGWRGSAEELVDHPRVRALLQARVDEANEGLARFEQVKRWDALPGPLTVESGERTPTLKLRRRVVEQVHAARIGLLYQ